MSCFFLHFSTAVILRDAADTHSRNCPLSFYSYDALKAQIYKYEKSALDSQANDPPTSYRDDTDVEGGSESAAAAHKAANEKQFVSMLDKELNKITDFYASKGALISFFLLTNSTWTDYLISYSYLHIEKELLEDLVYLEEDLEKFREGHYSDMDYDELDNRGRATSGASDSEDDDAGGEPARQGDRSGFSKVLTDPREYDAAIAAGRKSSRPVHARATSGDSQQKKSRSKSASKRSNGRRLSTASETGDLLGIDDEEETSRNDRRRRSSASESHSNQGRRPSYTTQPSEQGQSLGKLRSSGKLREVAQRMSSSFLAEEDDEGGDVTGASDWAIDTKIMYKRRLAALFTVSSPSSLNAL